VDSNEWYGKAEEAIKEFPASLALAIYSALAMISVFGLATYHCGLIWDGQTTNEQIRGKFRDRPNPYNHGVLKNFAQVFCSEIPPSQLNLTEELDVEEAAQLRRELEIWQENAKNRTRANSWPIFYPPSVTSMSHDVYTHYPTSRVSHYSTTRGGGVTTNPSRNDETITGSHVALEEDDEEEVRAKVEPLPSSKKGDKKHSKNKKTQSYDIHPQQSSSSSSSSSISRSSSTNQQFIASSPSPSSSSSSNASIPTSNSKLSSSLMNANKNGSFNSKTYNSLDQRKINIGVIQHGTLHIDPEHDEGEIDDEGNRDGDDDDEDDDDDRGRRHHSRPNPTDEQDDEQDHIVTADDDDDIIVRHEPAVFRPPLHSSGSEDTDTDRDV